MEIMKTDVIKKLDKNVMDVLGNNSLEGFQKAYLVAEAVGQLTIMLSEEYMKPIMNLQGNRLGFRTDKDNQGGYPMKTVKNCLIEAVLTGVQPVGNHFNIIAGNTYITKEGFGYLLDNIDGLKYSIVPEIPRIKGESAAIVMHIKWSVNGEAQEQKLDLPIKVNKFMGPDAVIGKATRKARAWLHATITGYEIGEGEVADVPVMDIDFEDAADTEDVEPAEVTRMKGLVERATTTQQLEDLREYVPDEHPELFDMIENKMQKVKK